MTQEEGALAELAAKDDLPWSVRHLIECATPGITETFDDGDGPEATAQRADRLGLITVHAYKGKWSFTLTEAGIATRALTPPQPEGE